MTDAEIKSLLDAPISRADAAKMFAFMMLDYLT